MIEVDARNERVRSQKRRERRIAQAAIDRGHQGADGGIAATEVARSPRDEVVRQRLDLGRLTVTERVEVRGIFARCHGLEDAQRPVVERAVQLPAQFGRTENRRIAGHVGIPVA